MDRIIPGRDNYFKVGGSLILIFLTVIYLFLLVNQNKKPQLLVPRAADAGISLKKGVAGGATLANIAELKVSWFYNWGYLPGYKNFDNFNTEVWQKFVPLFYGKNYLSVDERIAEICRKTVYCGKGNYYLVGNEPDQISQDATAGSADQVGDAVFRQGEVIKRIKTLDPTAKFIILGTANPDLNSRSFAAEFIRKWKTRWQNEPSIADLPAVIKGWHVHTEYCNPANTSLEQFKSAVDEQLMTTFRKNIADEEIWVTEMGRKDGGNVLSTVDCLVNKYESSGIVNRYAWFYLGCSRETHTYCPHPEINYNYLLYIGGTITGLGKKYAAMALTGIPPVTLSPTLPPSTPTMPFVITQTPTSTATPTGTVSLTPTITPINTSVPSPTPTVFAGPVLNFKIKFSGINTKRSAQKVKVVIKQFGNSLDYRFKDVGVTSDDEGVYSGLLALNGVPPNNNYQVIIKGPKHLARRFCRNSQTARCSGLPASGYGIVFRAGQNDYDFSGLALEAGDLPDPNEDMEQDGVANSLDFSLIEARVAQTDEPGLAVADLNLDGIVNQGDVGLLMTTLTVKYEDEY